MIDITHKSNTLRVATAQAVVKVSTPDTIAAIRNNTVPKGDVFAMSKAAGLLGVKKTPELLPDCHPMPIEYTGIEYSIEGLEITISVTIKTIYKTGVEVEAMHGASIVALNMYDMLKPIDKGIEIHHIKLLEKKGGKSSYPIADISHLKAGIVVCSDSISAGNGTDTSGQIIQERLLNFGVAQADVQIIPDDFEKIQSTVTALVQTYTVIILTGGTGLSSRDVTPEAIIPLLDKRLIGAEETLRRYGQERMPYAMLSRSVVGTIGRCLVLALPGSSKGVTESLDAVFPALFHTFKVLDGDRHV
jgi:cyclic pyranopterin monophosphate synthase